MATFVISKKPSGHYKYELTSRRGKPFLLAMLLNYDLNVKKKLNY